MVRGSGQLLLRRCQIVNEVQEVVLMSHVVASLTWDRLLPRYGHADVLYAVLHYHYVA